MTDVSTEDVIEEAAKVMQELTRESARAFLAEHERNRAIDELCQLGDDQDELLSIIINAPESGDALHVAEAERVREAILAAGFRRAEEPGWVESIQYGHLLARGVFIEEHRGLNYATHQRRVKIGPATPANWTATQPGADE